MVISTCSRLCVLRLKEYSDKKNTALNRPRTKSTASAFDTYRGNDNLNNNPNSSTPLVLTTNNDTLTPIIEDHSLLGRLLNCKPCRQVTENQQHKIVYQSDILPI
jgi:hypothetical protein